MVMTFAEEHIAGRQISLGCFFNQFYLFGCGAGAGHYVPQRNHQSTTCGGVSSPSTMWAPEIKVRFSGVVASVSSH